MNVALIDAKLPKRNKRQENPYGPSSYGAKGANGVIGACCACSQGAPGPRGKPGNDGQPGKDGRPGPNALPGKNGKFYLVIFIFLGKYLPAPPIGTSSCQKVTFFNIDINI